MSSTETEQSPALALGRRGAGRAFFLRLHFYAAVFVGPFLLIAAISGGLYAISPSLEQVMYQDYLRTTAAGPALPLSEQVRAAQHVRPDLTVTAVRPADGPGETTRVLFADPSLVSRQLLDDLLRYKRIDGVTELLGSLGAALFGGGRQAALPARQLLAGPPLLVVWGADDRVIPAAHAQAAPAGATVAVLPGAGHMVMMEKAGEFNALLRKHLAR